MGRRSPGLMARARPLTARLGWVGALTLITALGCVLRFAALDAKTLWLDETFSWWMARHTLPELTVWLVQIDHHPPLYYYLLHYWIKGFGDGATALRALSALASVLTIPIYGFAARRFAGDGVALVAALLLAFSPFHLRYAQETRMYSVLVLAVALLMLAVAQVLTVRTTAARGRWWVLLACAEAAAMFTHNTATVLVPLALNVAVVGAWWGARCGNGRTEFDAMADPRFGCRWCRSQLGALLLWSPWSVAFVRQAQAVDSDFWIAAPDVWAVWSALGNLTFAHLPAWLALREQLTWLALLLVGVGLWQWRVRAGLTWLLLSLWLVPPVVELIASLRRPIFYDRTLIWTTLPYFMLIARGIMWPAAQRTVERVVWTRAWQGSALALMLAINLLGINGYFRSFEKEAWDEVAAVVATHTQPQELVLFHASWAEVPFSYYYPQGGPAIDAHGVPADLFDAGVLEPPMTVDDVARVRQLVAGKPRVWLVYSHWWYTDPDGLLLQTLEVEFDVVDEYIYPGIRVIAFSR